MSDTVQFYTATQIDRSLLAWLLEHHVYQRGTSTMRSSLRKIYKRMESAGLHCISHLWVMCNAGGQPIGVALIEKREVNSLQLFVKDDYRYAGRGEQLLTKAMASGVKFGVYYTGSSRALYQKYHLVNLCDENASIT